MDRYVQSADPGRGDLEDSPPSEARGRPTADYPGPCPPRNVRLGCLSLRQRTWSRWRHARSDGVAHTSERLPSGVSANPLYGCGHIMALGRMACSLGLRYEFLRIYLNVSDPEYLLYELAGHPPTYRR